MGREMDRRVERDGKTDVQMGRETNIWAERQMEGQIDIKRWIDRQREMDRRVERQIDVQREMDIQVDSH